MDHQKADKNHSKSESKDQSRRPLNALSRHQLQELGERDLWVSAMASWMKWPQLSYDGTIWTTLIRM